MGNQEDFPTNLTPEEETAGFRLRWITNDDRGRADQPELLQAVDRAVEEALALAGAAQH